MTTNVVYFTVGGKPEQAEFSSDFPADEIKDLFRCAAEAGPYDILKLYNTRGNLVNISPALQENTPGTRYKLEVVAANCASCGFCDSESGCTLDAIEARLQALERSLIIENGETSPVVQDMKLKVNSFKDKLESVEHLSWLGLFKEMSSGTSKRPSSEKHSLRRRTSSELNSVLEKFKKMSNAELTDQTRNLLRKPSFDNWQWEDAEMLYLLQQMYTDLNLIEIFNIEIPILQNFLFEVFRNYNATPFHNFRHAFCVTQMMYGLIWLTQIPGKVQDCDVLVMLTSALCHDLDHPGYNNAYQVNARTELAIRYNDISPLENHHCAVAFDIISQPRCDIIKNVSQDVFRKFREGMIKCILSTDMARHNEILNKFKDILADGFSFENEVHKSMLMQIMIKVSDVSNEARPMEVAEPWLDCLLQEFFIQSDVEKLEGLPVAPFMDRDKVTKPSAQIGFIRFVLIPLFEALGQLFPVLEVLLFVPDKISEHNYRAVGSKNPEKSARVNGNRLRNKCNKAIQSSTLCHTNYTFIRWTEDVESRHEYDKALADIKDLYEANDEFRADIRESTEAALRCLRNGREKGGCNKENETTDADAVDLNEGVLYLLKELAFLVAVPSIYKDCKEFVFVYHRSWPVLEKYFNGRYDGIEKPSLGFVVFE